MVHGYDIKTSFDFFRKLLDEREDFLKAPSSARYAINCAITAWQLHDWVYAERDRYPFMAQFKSKNDFRNYLYRERNFSQCGCSQTFRKPAFHLATAGVPPTEVTPQQQPVRAAVWSPTNGTNIKK